MPQDSLLVAYKDHDRTPLLYVLREMAARHEDLEVRIERIGDEYEERFLNGGLDLVL